ncbi:tyrosine recombinase XerC [Streptomyces sp. NPDC057543]|uniref:site-specific integrase n=1 Tax=Streptomyces sp. NPDC057543 TaxID=3346163 RepID=UPI00367A43E0
MRCTLSAIDNGHLAPTAPKTQSSRGWVAMSPRVAAALRHRARSAPRTRADPNNWSAGPVFCRPDGRPLGPHVALDRLHQLSEEAGVPRIAVHDLRHLAATITITAGVPLTVASKALRHSTLSTTANLYSHLTSKQPAQPSTTPSPEPSALAAVRTGQCGCDHHATTSTTSAKPSTSSTPPHRPPSTHWRTGPGPGVRSHCDHHTPERTKGRPLMDERTTSDLRFRTVGTTGFEPATP